MRTTLNLDSALMKQAKQRALERNETLTHLIEAALRQLLQPAATPDHREPFRLRLLTKGGRTRPGVRIDDRDALYEQMEGRS